MAIFVYPLLTASNVNPTIIPGVCKALEKHVIVFEQDKIFTAAANEAKKDKQYKFKGKVKVSGGKLRLEDATEIYQESIETFLFESKLLKQLNEADGDRTKPGGSDRNKKNGDLDQQQKDLQRDRDNFESEKNRTKSDDAKNKLTKTINQLEKDIDRIEDAKEALRNSKANVRVTPIQNEKTLTLEPTYVSFETSADVTRFVGIKVVPYTVKSDAALTELLVHDKEATKLQSFVKKYARKIMSAIFKRWYSITNKSEFLFGLLGLGQKGTGTGNAKSDVIMRRTKYEDRVFTMVNIEDFDDDFFKEAGGINKLFGLQWNSIVVDDPVNKKVAFCAKEYKGNCTIVPYQFLYSSVSSDAGRAFESIEDIKKSASPMFKVGGRLKAMVGEELANKKLSTFTNLHESAEFIEEAFCELNEADLNAIKNLSMAKIKDFMKLIGSAVKTKDTKKINTALKKVKVKPPTRVQMMKLTKSKFGPSYTKSHNLSKRVIENSLHPAFAKYSPELSHMICLMSTDKEDKIDPKKLKKNIARVVAFSRKKLTEKGNIEMDYETKVVMVILTIAIVCGTVLTGIALVHLGPGALALVTSLGGVATAIANNFGWLLVFMAILGVLSIAGATMSAIEAGEAQKQ